MLDKLGALAGARTVRDGTKEERTHPETTRKDQEIEGLRKRLHGRDREITELRKKLDREDAGVGGVRPENVIWIFGTARSGTTWLASMMEESEGLYLWREPLVGELFGHFYYVRGSEDHRRGEHFVLGRHREAWLASELGIPVDEEGLARAVEKHSWEMIPEKRKGEGKFYRKASPGSWREDLAPEQVRIVEETTAPLLEELYPERGGPR